MPSPSGFFPPSGVELPLLWGRARGEWIFMKCEMPTRQITFICIKWKRKGITLASFPVPKSQKIDTNFRRGIGETAAAVRTTVHGEKNSAFGYSEKKIKLPSCKQRYFFLVKSRAVDVSGEMWNAIIIKISALLNHANILFRCFHGIFPPDR